MCGQFSPSEAVHWKGALPELIGLSFNSAVLSQGYGHVIAVLSDVAQTQCQLWKTCKNQVLFSMYFFLPLYYPVSGKNRLLRGANLVLIALAHRG